MRIAIFDGINESHVGSSFERALLARGHAVLNTGKIGHGFEFETDAVRLLGIERWIDVVADFRPDVVFVFRPATLPKPQLARLKRCGATLVAWFSDDPVLWDLSYRPIVEHYDLILHCGSERVLAFYEAGFGRPTGPNFPFWTDGAAFPYVYGELPPESDILFLGNVQDEVRRDRYFAMGELRSDIRIHGAVGIDFLGLGAGYLDFDSEVVDAGRRARLALNIPQFFRDHTGLPTWFHGLDELGFFQYPSRVIQYAALGLPTMTLCPEPDQLRTFPELVVVDSISAVDLTAAKLLRSDLDDLSRRTRARFESAFSAGARVSFLEHLLVSDDWRSMDTRGRAELFAHFPPAALTYDESRRAEPSIRAQSGPLTIATLEEARIRLVGSRPRERTAVRDVATSVAENVASAHGDSVFVVGTGWTRPTAQINVVTRALRGLGHQVVAANPFGMPCAYSKDESREYKRFFDPIKLQREMGCLPSSVVLLGGETGISAKGADRLREHGCTTLVLDVTSRRLTAALARLATRVDLLCTPSRALQSEFVTAGFDNVRYLPRLIDDEARKIVSHVTSEASASSVSVIGRRRSDLLAFPAVARDVAHLRALEWYTSEHEGYSLHDIAAPLSSSVVVAPPNHGVAGVHAEIIPFVLAAGALLVLPRVVDRSLELPPDSVLQVREPGEIEKKLRRVWNDPGAYDRRLAAAHAVVDKLAAEANIAAALELAVSLGKAETSKLNVSLGVDPSPGAHPLWTTRLETPITQATVLDLHLSPVPGPGIPGEAALTVRLDMAETLRIPFPRQPEFICLVFPPGERPDTVSLDVVLNGPVGIYNWAKGCAISVEARETSTSARITRKTGATSIPAQWRY